MYVCVNVYRFVEVAATIFNGGNLSAAMLSNGKVCTYMFNFNSVESDVVAFICTCIDLHLGKRTK